MLRRSGCFLNMGLGDEYVKKVFNSVASKYDMMNDVLSLGIHRLWKREFVRDYVRPCPGGSYVDVAGGTGDIAFRIIDEVRQLERGLPGLTPPDFRGVGVTVVDINEQMVHEGEARAAREGYDGLEWIVASGEELPLDDMQFDGYTVSFGLRNFSDRPKALREAHRVLKVGGVLSVLEFSKVTCSLLRVPYDVWSYGFIPQAGRILANEESYRYLVDSIRAFPDQETLAEMIREAGFGYVRYDNLSGGIACVHTAVKTEAVPIHKPKSEVENAMAQQERVVEDSKVGAA
ncbi:ubiquinone biosynthesis methyltransferase, putative [Trypanosoma equiperdum]|uniref:2-methoxy-6-polyprenyl-1,4-benzoquinol methylase, mitochondrial n=2 Tax=Trypanozoon TaxID=39700 RepID=Q383M8_TRYB2|nr:ubiquinone biosynthesis methyltransferase, putative [Trypanosoma brucei brucei TREU927]EAN80003.1 ubiquinone biosynthesis methyltransferase, putative [Trypanosoma brucei brucei TREU927]SCU72797.1 ubiquinone biosynthesis methyltransferase, putative [Trypanosoma equiperdum]